MPNAFPTLLDVVKLNAGDDLVGLISETEKACPEVIVVPARTIKGINFPTTVRVQLPAVGFRDANDGVDSTVARYENRLVETFIFNPIWKCDKAVADGYEDGPQAYIAVEAGAIMEGSFQTLSTQFYYGASLGGHAKGHVGLMDMYDKTKMEVDAGGTTGSTGSSVWLVRYGPKHVEWVWGNGKDAFAMDDPRIGTIVGQNSKELTGYIQELLARPGVKVGSLKSIARIKKLTADAGKGLTDDLIYEALAKFPAGVRPDAMFMTTRSQEQLRKSRTATNATGAPAPIPEEVANVPILVTDGITNTESLTLGD